ncbi:DUF3006 domain-containing protein [Natronomonas marina]|jgi:hypothetical protein|uniref:DUF3006 domain-containing protein n=1 Tax=Natronomonas marina TaxID=2961939 RepID=UPI0020C9732C|nr:DUF3006 domain-containing protein [Natronomonas marina]
MIPDGTYTAVLDRIEDGVATLLLEEDGEDAHQLDVDPSVLPADARHSDAVLTVEIDDGELVATSYEPEETDERQESAQSRFDRLSERAPRDDESG